MSLIRKFSAIAAALLVSMTTVFPQVGTQRVHAQDDNVILNVSGDGSIVVSQDGQSEEYSEDTELSIPEGEQVQFWFEPDEEAALESAAINNQPADPAVLSESGYSWTASEEPVTIQAVFSNTQEQQDSAESQELSDQTDFTAGMEEADMSSEGLAKADLVEAAKLSPERFYALQARTAEDAASSQTEALPTEADGYKIDGLSMTWIMPEETREKMTVTPGTNDPFALMMRMNLNLSGTKPYQPGAISITIPKTIWKDRNGDACGKMTLSVPEYPDSSGTFAYTETEKSYVLTNVRTLPAAVNAYMEFKIDQVTPSKIKDLSTGYQTDPFFASLQVETDKGTLIGEDSNSITANIHTDEVVKSATKTASEQSETWDENWPAELKPENPDDYYYIVWYAYADTEGNQPFSLYIKDNPEASGISGTKLLGYEQNGEVIPAKESETGNGARLIDRTYFEDDNNGFTNIYMAYPKSHFTEVGSHDISNFQTYTLVSEDTGHTTTAEASAQSGFVTYAYAAPTGHFYVEKYPENASGEIADTSSDLQAPDTKPVAEYPDDLDKLLRGESVDLHYSTHTTALGEPWTLEGEAKQGNYGKKSYSVETEDDRLYFNEKVNGAYADAARLQSSDDYEFKSLHIQDPDVYTYGQAQQEITGFKEENGYAQYGFLEKGEWGYLPDDQEADYPDLEVYGKTSLNGSYIHYATISYSDPSRTAAYNQAEVTGDTVVFPAGVVGWKTSFSTRMAGVIWDIEPVVTLKPTQNIKNQIRELYKNEETPKTTLSNVAGMNAYSQDGASITRIGYEQPLGDQTAADELSSVALAVQAHKHLDSSKNNTSSRSVDLTWTLKVDEQSNLSSLDDYNQAVEDGAISQETSGTFYDLLPAGVSVDQNSIRLRDEDTITSVEQIADYKGSGRTLLIVRADLHPSPYLSDEGAADFSGYCDSPQMTLHGTYNWENLHDFGKNLNNVFAFESGTDGVLGTMKGYQGEFNADPSQSHNTETAAAISGVEDLMTNLPSDRPKTNQNFVYASAADSVEATTSAVTGLTKLVSANGSGEYGDGSSDQSPVNVYPDGIYTYRIRVQNDDSTASKNLVFYDTLDGWTRLEDADRGDKTWKGTLLGVDTSELKQKGIDPKVFVSEKNLNLYDSDHPADTDLGNTENWQTLTDQTDLSKVTSIAIDCTEKEDGTPFVLDKNKGISAYIKMRAPSGFSEDDYDSELNGKSEAGNGGAHAYNAVSMKLTEMKEGTTDTDGQIYQAYTKVGVLPFNIRVIKEWEDDDNNDQIRPSSIQVTLQAADEKGNKKSIGDPVTLNASNHWKYTWKNVTPTDRQGHPMTFTVSETDESGNEIAGYSCSIQTSESEDGKGLVLNLKNMHQPEKIAISGKKRWVGTASHRVPDTVMIGLYKNGVYDSSTEAKSPDWTYSFGPLNKFENGKEIVWTVKEESYVPGFASSVSGSDITNTWHPYGDIVISKTLQNSTVSSKNMAFAFRFHLYRSDGKTPMPGQFAYATSDGRSGTISNGQTLTLKDGQTATIKNVNSDCVYDIKELPTTGSEPVSSDRITDTLQAGSEAKADFTNRYVPSGQVSLKVTKSVQNGSLPGGTFLFELKDENGNVIRKANADSNGEVDFGLLEYDRKDINEDGEGLHRYTISEVNGGRPGYTYDESICTAAVKLKDDGLGHLNSTVTYSKDGKEAETAAFQNIYTAKGSSSIKVWKQLKGRTLKADEFSFELKDESGKVLQTAKNDEYGNVPFKPIEFNETQIGKTITYTVSEVKGSDEDVNYDGTVYQFECTVKDDGDGTLSIDQKFVPNGSESAPVFSNMLKPGSLQVDKLIDGAMDPSADFTFRVKITPPAGETLPEDVSKYEHIQINENEEKIASSLDEVKDTEQNDTSKPKQELPSVSGKAQKAEASPAVLPEAESEESEPAADDFLGTPYAVLDVTTGTLTFDRTAEGESVPTGTSTQEVFPLEDSGDYDDSPFDSESSQIKHIRMNKWYKLGDEVDNLFSYMDQLEDADLSKLDMRGTIFINSMFEGCTRLTSVRFNKLDPSAMSVAAYMFADCISLKTVDLSGWKANDYNGRQNAVFSYMFSGCTSLESVDLSGLDCSGHPQVDCTSMFSGCTSLESVNLASFNNRRSWSVKNMFSGCAKLKKLVLGPNFLFCQTHQPDAELQPVPTDPPYTGKWVSTSSPDKYTSEELMKNYNSSMAGTWVWETKSYTIKFSGGTGASGSMADLIVPDGSKVKVPECGFYWFNHTFENWNVREGPGDPVVEAGSDQTFTPGADGIVYLTANWHTDSNEAEVKDGIYTFTLKGNEGAVFKDIPAGSSYTVWEEAPSGWEQISAGNTNGTIDAQKTAVASFTNQKTESKSCSAQILASKLLDGKSPDGKSFDFVLSENGSALQTVQNSADGTIAFRPITYTEAGTHTYQISERAGSGSDFKYDSAVYAVTVTVTEDTKNNALKAEVQYPSGTPVFRNTTNPSYGQMEVSKTVENKPDGFDPDFTFRLSLTQTGGTPYEGAVTMKKSDGDPEIVTGGTFTLKDSETAVFTIPENIHYDVEEIDVPSGYTPEQASLSGVIAANQTVSVPFKNTYAASPATAIVQARKNLKGRKLADGAFTFILKNENGDRIDQASNTQDGAIVFNEMSYSKAGTYKYTIAEEAGTDDSIEYDSSIHSAEVIVTDNGDGTLKAEVSYPEDADGVVFNNSVKPIAMPESGSSSWPAVIGISGLIGAGTIGWIVTEDRKKRRK